MRFQLIQTQDAQRFAAEQLVNLNLFDGEAFFGRLLCLQRGQAVPVHVHAHKDECFDVLQGEGTLLVDGQEVRAGPGTMLYVPVGVRHGLRADGTDCWVLRETVSERVYLRRAVRLLWQAFMKRMPWRQKWD
ncbi:MAG: cupin domain-containing protein [Anaerolineae bacterium]